MHALAFIILLPLAVGSTDFPGQIWVQEPLRETVARMWMQSPTFRRQCLRVQAAGRIQVQIRLDPTLMSDSDHHAIVEIRTYDSGAIVARINVAPMRLTELIAHEMEHVCERLDGIKVEVDARNGKVGVHRLGAWGQRYETDRAVRVGRQVRAEMNVTAVLTRSQ